MSIEQIKRKIKELKKIYPDLSSFDYYAMAINESEASPNVIEEGLDRLVSKNDYKTDDKNTILEYLMEISYKN